LTMPQREQAGVRIAVASNADEAEFLRGALTFAGVPCVLDSVEVEGDPSEWVKQIGIWVPEQQERLARMLLFGSLPGREALSRSKRMLQPARPKLSRTALILLAVALSALLVVAIASELANRL